MCLPYFFTATTQKSPLQKSQTAAAALLTVVSECERMESQTKIEFVCR